jgi:hypothetical protein
VLGLVIEYVRCFVYYIVKVLRVVTTQVTQRRLVANLVE